MRKTVTIFVPEGYKDAEAFLLDCKFEEAPPQELHIHYHPDTYHRLRGYRGVVLIEPVAELFKDANAGDVGGLDT